MGCNCKKGLKAAKKLSGMDKGNGGDSKEEGEGLAARIARMLMQFVFGAVLLALSLVVMIPILAYVGVCVMIGKEPVIRLFNLKKRMGRGSVKANPALAKQ